MSEVNTSFQLDCSIDKGISMCNIILHSVIFIFYFSIQKWRASLFPLEKKNIFKYGFLNCKIDVSRMLGTFNTVGVM